jgi:hypothetical protein
MGVRAATPHGGTLMSRDRVRALNDAFRTNFARGTVLLSASVDALPDMVKANALLQVAQFSEFDEDNDPHGEHDFGSFSLCGRRFFWKIDYYDRDMKYGSEEPADPEKTSRVLTLMLADDY